MRVSAKDTAKDVAGDLLRWYDQSRRSLPWREDPTPYHVWISEIMLQQTRVEAVKGYYARFLERFPDIRTLAEAEEDECLKLWEGLGYYSRVRNLRRAAIEIMTGYDGEMPHTSGELRKLPGIGPYTAAAIASIAHGEKIPAVDGNLLRVFSRLALYEEEIKTPKAAAAAKSYFFEIMPEDRPGDFNQALMDLGAGVCVPGELPLCQRDPSACPLSPFCGAFSENRCSDLPVMPVKKARRREKRTVLLIRDSEKILLRRRPSGGLLAGLFEFPNEEGWLTQEEAVARARAYGCEPVKVVPLQEARHIFTHREWLMHGYELWIGSFPEKAADAEPQRDTGETLLSADAEPQRDPEETLPSAGAEPQRNPGGREPFFVGVNDLQDRYAIPSAYAAYLSRLRQGV